MGFGDAWKSWDENLHPRDKRGRFAKKFKWSKSVISKLDKFLTAFSPRTFQNDAQAAQYAFNQGARKPWNREEYARLHMDIDQANAHLRTGDMDEETKRFVQTMDAHKIPADSDLIVSRTVDASAFGMTADQLGLEDGGIEDWIGKLIADRGYNTGQMGGIVTSRDQSTNSGGVAGVGKVTMRIAVPKGTAIIPFARHRDDRGMSFDRDQEFRVTQVQPDGSGGWYMAAVATPRTKGDTPTPINAGPSGVDLTPEQRAQRVREMAGTRLPSEVKEEERAQERIALAEAALPADQQRRQQRLEDLKVPAQPPRQEDLRARQAEVPAEPPQTSEQLPEGVEPRTEPVITPGGAPAPGAEAPAAPVAPTPDEFKTAVREAGLPSPSVGARRREWNEAYLGIAKGKKDPADALRELETDIRVNRETKPDPKDPNLASDIEAQEKLAQLISDRYGIPRQGTPTPSPAPEVPSPAPAAKKAVSSQGGTKAAGLTPEQQESVKNRVARMHSEGKFNPDNPEHQRLQSLVDQMTPAKKAVKAPAAKKAVPVKAPAAKAAPVKAAVKKAAPKVPTASLMSRLSTADRRVARDLGLPDDHPLVRVAERATEDGTRQGILDILRDLHDDDVKQVAKELGIPLPAGMAASERRRYIADNLRAFGQGGLAPAKKAAPTPEPEAPSPVKAAKRAAPAKKAAPEPRPMPKGAKVQPGDRVQWTDSSGETVQGTVGRDRRTYVDWDSGRREYINAARLEDIVPIRGDEGAEKPLAKNTIPELRKIAEAEGVELKSKMVKADIVKAIELERAGKASPRLPAAPVTAEDEALLRAREAGTDLPSAPAAETAARTRQQEIDDTRQIADLLSEIAMLQDNEVSQEAFKARLDAAATRIGTPEARSIADDAIRTGVGNTDELRGFVGEGRNLTPIGAPRARVPFDPKLHQASGDAKFRKGQMVEVFRPGYEWDRNGEKIQISKAQVMEADEAPIVRKAEKRVPEGSVPGPRAQAPITTPERKAEFKEALKGEDLPRGSAGRAMKEIRDDVASGKITPEEGVRRMETEIALNRDELSDIEATLRGQMTPGERRKLVSQAEDLEKAIEAQEKASVAMRGHFEAEAPISGKKELLRLEVPADVKEALDKATPEDLKEAAKREGFEDLKGDTVDEVIQDFAKKVAAQELAKRAVKKAAPKKAPAKVTAAPKIDRERLDARTIAQGLDIEKWDVPVAGHTAYLADVQDALDGKRVAELPPNSTPAAIGRWLEKRAKRIRDSAAIRTGVKLNSDPEFKAEQDQIFARRMAEAASLSELAKRLQATRRVFKKAAPAKKAAPEVKAAEARADVAEVRLLQNAIDDLREAKTETDVRRAVRGLTFPEIRELGNQHGVRGRTKESIISGLVDRYTKPEPPSSGETRGLAQILDEMGSFENPASREAVADAIKDFGKAELLAEAKKRSIPGVGRLTAPELRAELVEASVGRRLDSIATRGFRGLRPTMPSEVDAEVVNEQQAERASRLREIAQGQAAQLRQTTGRPAAVPMPASGNWQSVRDRVENLGPGQASPGEIGSIVADLPLEDLRAWADSLGTPKNVNTRSSLIGVLVDHYGETFEDEE